jgi:hypothetical protein
MIELRLRLEKQIYLGRKAARKGPNADLPLPATTENTLSATRSDLPMSVDSDTETTWTEARFMPANGRHSLRSSMMRSKLRSGTAVPQQVPLDSERQSGSLFRRIRAQSFPSIPSPFFRGPSETEQARAEDDGSMGWSSDSSSSA